MRWLTLYARSRQVPAAFAVLLLGAAVVTVLARGGEGPGDPRMSALALAVGATAASVGLGGQDPALDRTAAVNWILRRALHVLLIGVVVAGVLVAARSLGGNLAAPGFLLRDSAGLMGLAALGAVLCGAPYAWLLPVGWLSFALFAPAPQGVPGQVMSWLLLAPDAAAGAWTALALAAAGTAAYAVAGPRA